MVQNKLRVGYLRSAFERDYAQKAFDAATLDVLRAQGITLVPVELPDVEYGAMRMILTAEAAAAFDELTRSNRDAELTEQGPNAWPNTFRVARFIPAVDYINANRVRTMSGGYLAEIGSDEPRGPADLEDLRLAGRVAGGVVRQARVDGDGSARPGAGLRGAQPGVLRGRAAVRRARRRPRRPAP